MAGFIFGEGTDIKDPQELKRRREIIDAMMAQGQRAPQNIGEGIYSASKSITDALVSRGLKKKEDAARQEASGALPNIVAMLNGGQQPSPFAPQSTPSVAAQPRTPDSAGGIADATMQALGKPVMGPYRDAIASIESAGSGDYSAVGPTNERLGRALGRYQIMEANIGPWSEEVLGRKVTPEEFLANPQLQDAIFDGKFGGYVEQFGPEGAAQAWFAGPGGVGKMDRQDVLGTSVADYTQKFSAALGGGQPAGGTPAPAGNTQQAFNPEIINQLAALSSNPYASPGQQQIAQMLMQSQVQQMMPQDPMRALELERAQLENERLRNPQPDLTTTQREYAAAQSQGFQGTFLDYQTALAEAKRTQNNVNVNTAGQPMPELLGTQGLVAIPDPSVEEGYRVVPAPGSPIAVEREQAAAAAERAAANQAENETTRSNVVQETTGAIRGMLDKGGIMNLPEVGVIGSRLAGVNQEAADMSGMLDTLKGMVAFDRLDKLRQASATGASGLGQVTEREIALLAAQLGALDQSLSADRIRATLDTIDSVFGKLSPGAQAFLMGQSESLPQGTGAPVADDVPTFNPQTGQWE